MTSYTRDGTTTDWEFKILRSTTNAFRRQELLGRALEEEALGGWELVEKFDDGRLRLKRPIAARQGDALLPAEYNPYRTQFGISEGTLAAAIVFGVLAFAALGLWLAFTFGLIS